VPENCFLSLLGSQPEQRVFGSPWLATFPGKHDSIGGFALCLSGFGSFGVLLLGFLENEKLFFLRLVLEEKNQMYAAEFGSAIR
jgi:hypothetical protein